MPNQQTQTTAEIFGPEIYSYSREQAIEDGVLIDCSDLAKQAGFLFPVAITRPAWERWVEVKKTSRNSGQSETGRLWDIFTILRISIKRAESYDQLFFRVIISRRWANFKAVCGPGDQCEPVITIMLPEED